MDTLFANSRIFHSLGAGRPETEDGSWPKFQRLNLYPLIVFDQMAK